MQDCIYSMCISMCWVKGYTVPAVPRAGHLIHISTKSVGIPFILTKSFGVLVIHETEIKQFGNRNGRNRVKIISTLGHKSRIVETDYEGRNELRGSKRITRVETNYKGRNGLRC